MVITVESTSPRQAGSCLLSHTTVCHTDLVNASFQACHLTQSMWNALVSSMQDGNSMKLEMKLREWVRSLLLSLPTMGRTAFGKLSRLPLRNWKQSSSRAAYIFHVSFSPVSHYKTNSLSSSNWLPYSGKLSGEKTRELGFLPRKFPAIRYSFTSEC